MHQLHPPPPAPAGTSLSLDAGFPGIPTWQVQTLKSTICCLCCWAFRINRILIWCCCCMWATQSKQSLRHRFTWWWPRPISWKPILPKSSTCSPIVPCETNARNQ